MFITFSRQVQEILFFAWLLFIPIDSSNGLSCKVCSSSCFLLMGFWNLHIYCCTTSLGRWDFCEGVLPRDSIGPRDIPYIENPYLHCTAVDCVEETLVSPENNLILNFLIRRKLSVMHVVICGSMVLWS